ncbi:MAG: hydrolase Nlp/P60, partial [Acidimicrobiales bacterium]
MRRWAMAALLGAVTVVVGLILIVAVMAGSGAGSTATSPSGADSGDPGSGGIAPGAAIPSGWAALYQQAATTCPGLSWSVLAAVGTVETGSGQSDAPGVRSGSNPAGAEGPMQFEPATFAAYATVGPDGAQPASPYDPVDAVYTAAALLCADG